MKMNAAAPVDRLKQLHENSLTELELGSAPGQNHLTE
jgi:hypothetical protein